MLLAMLLQVSMHASAKHLLQTYSLVQTIWARYVFYLIIVVLVYAPQRKDFVRTTRLRSHLLRGTILFLVSVFYFLSLDYMGIAEANAIYLTSPVFVMLLSAFVLGVEIRKVQWFSILLGCIGMTLVIRPGAHVFQVAAVLPLLGALSLATFKLYTSSLNDTEPIQTSLFYPALVGTLITSLLLPLDWISPPLAGWADFVLIGFFGAAFQFTFVKALSIIPAFLATTFTYTQLIWSVLLGLLLFDERPGVLTLLGGLLISACGILSVWNHRSSSAG